MKKNFAIAWAHNLRNSKIKQCYFQLGLQKDGCSVKAGKHPAVACVLGVLGETVNEMRRKQKKKQFNIDYSKDTLPIAVRRYVGMKDGIGTYGTGYNMNLIHDNDKKKHSFKQMAKTILKYQKQL